jgi:prolyl-tRNA synthetase
MAGVYTLLPLGLRVQNKIVRIIREEMNLLGGKEMAMASLQDPNVWQKTGRWDDEALDIWFKTKLKSGSEVGLASTHEEPLAELMTHYVSSYKDLPVYVYQFQTKFRNELRAKSGLMRVREFLMKDLYSFNRSEEEFEEFYGRARRAYEKIFDRVGLGALTYYTFASGKPFTDGFSHEFQTLSDAGEDTIYLSEEKKIAVNKEVFNDKVLDMLNLKKTDLVEKKAIEVGNIFPLGTKYSEAMGLKFTDKDGTQKPVVMGSYGIGPGRVMGTIAEVLGDDKGIVWPDSVAPFDVHLVELDADAKGVYEDLRKADIEVLYDDREISAGEKFADSDLIGVPYRVVVSAKTLEKDGIEVKRRDSKESKIMKEDEFIKMLKK